MSSCILPFRPYKRQARRHADIMKAAVSDAARTAFAQCDPELLEGALRTAAQRIDRGGNFTEAMDAIARTVGYVSIREEPLRTERIASIERRVISHVDTMMKLSERWIRLNWPALSDSCLTQALARARRIYEGGGTFDLAMYHAIGAGPDDPSGPKAA